MGGQTGLHVYDRIFEQFRIIGSEDHSIVSDVARHAQWLETPGCLFQRNNFVLDSEIRTEGVIKPGLFLTVVLKGAGGGGPRKGTQRFRYSNNSIAVLALREPTLWGGDAPRGAQMQAAGVAFPLASLERIGLREEFLALFSDERAFFVTTFKAPPRILAIAAEMISPSAEGRAGELLLAAHATELLARIIVALRAGNDMGAVTDPRRMRLQAVRELIESDLRHAWTIAELARHAGLSRRSFNAQFHRLFGTSASEYLRTSRLKSAREALLHQGLTVTEAAYAVGYTNPANFSTAFRRHFGYVPSSCQRDKAS
ncbi:helix-turn-helix transcriptional regulator [Bradyrhizobium lablabi]|nr:AraC family transcriptional regulator [Bradyrhizobium lablabi]MBR1125644.1 helix-turn-helix transcriptional regulator [Bradyrhizobium lablabi]